MIKVFAYGDGPKDWVAAKTKESADKLMIERVGNEDFEWYDFEELSEEQIDKITFVDEDDPSQKQTCRQRLNEAIEVGEFPCVIECTE